MVSTLTPDLTEGNTGRAERCPKHFSFSTRTQPQAESRSLCSLAHHYRREEGERKTERNRERERDLGKPLPTPWFSTPNGEDLILSGVINNIWIQLIGSMISTSGHLTVWLNFPPSNTSIAVYRMMDTIN